MCKIEKVGFSCKIDGNFALTNVVALNVQHNSNSDRSTFQVDFYTSNIK